MNIHNTNTINESLDVMLEVDKDGLEHAKPLLLYAVSRLAKEAVNLIGGSSYH